MSLSETIRTSFNQILVTNGTEITNIKTNNKFIGLVTSGDFAAEFTEGDQETELSFLVTMFSENAPKTGDILIINSKMYIVQQVQSRANGVITKVTVFEKKRQKK